MISEFGERPALGGRYRLERLLREDERLAVWSARDVSLGRSVRVELVSKQLSTEEGLAQRLRGAARMAAALSHPNIATLQDIGSEGGQLYLVIEHVDARPLSQVLREEGALAPVRTIDLALQVCAAVGAAHDAGVVHGRLTPDAVLLSEDDVVKLRGFGTDDILAGQADRGDSAAYRAPERAPGGEGSRQADVYSLGVVLYEMLAGRRPGHAPPAEAAESDVALTTPLHDLNPQVPQQLETIVMQALDPDPSARYPSASELYQRLANYRSWGEQATGFFEPLSVGPQAIDTFPIPAVGVAGGQVSPFDWTGLALGCLALIAVAGLVPLYGAVLAMARESSLRAAAPPVTPIAPGGELVPDLTGRLASDAEAAMTAAGHRIRIAERWGGVGTTGQVIEQSPAPGARLEAGQPIELVVSSGSVIRLDAELAPGLRLMSADVPAKVLKPGEQLDVVLRWEVTAPLERDYWVFARLHGADGGLLAGQENEPARGRSSTSAWLVGERVRDPYELRVPVDAASGAYGLYIGLMDLQGGPPLRIVDPGQGAEGERGLRIFTVNIE